jgi:hypothetical protein
VGWAGCNSTAFLLPPAGGQHRAATAAVAQGMMAGTEQLTWCDSRATIPGRAGQGQLTGGVHVHPGDGLVVHVEQGDVPGAAHALQAGTARRGLVGGEKNN